MICFPKPLTMIQFLSHGFQISNIARSSPWTTWLEPSLFSFFPHLKPYFFLPNLSYLLFLVDGKGLFLRQPMPLRFVTLRSFPLPLRHCSHLFPIFPTTSPPGTSVSLAGRWHPSTRLYCNGLDTPGRRGGCVSVNGGGGQSWTCHQGLTTCRRVVIFFRVKNEFSI